MISVDALTVEIGGAPLFSDISFVINPKDRIALMGKNGAGKSTLLKILSGTREATRGKVNVPSGVQVAYLPQHLLTEDGRTVFEEAEQAFSSIHQMAARMEELNEALNTRTDYDSPEYMAIIEEVSALGEKYYAIEEINYDKAIELTLLGLGFKRSDFTRQTSEFSGGWRMRIELAKLLLQKPDVLLLDEPTNHLDIESIQWLEDFLIETGQTVVVISHDRAFVDHITTRTLEITMGRLYDYKVNYSEYQRLRAERREQQNEGDVFTHGGMHEPMQGGAKAMDEGKRHQEGQYPARSDLAIVMVPEQGRDQRHQGDGQQDAGKGDAPVQGQAGAIERLGRGPGR